MPTAAIKRAIAVAPKVPVSALVGATSIGGFTALLLQDQVPPILMYGLQVFLAV